MDQTDHTATSAQQASAESSTRLPYTPPVVESLGGTLATLLASGCSPCSICPPDPDADAP